MISKVREKEKVIALRKKGLNYREILSLVPVSKSSISLWLKDLPLTEAEKKILKDKKTSDITRRGARAGASLRAAKERRNMVVYADAKADFNKYCNDPFFQLGIGLYWAEGSKRSSRFGFTNSDPEMVKLMITWIERFLAPTAEVKLRVYTHKSFAHENHELLWANITGIPMDRFQKTIYKSQGLIVKKRPNYSGCVRVELPGVRYLRKMLFWQQILIEHYRKQR